MGVSKNQEHAPNIFGVRTNLGQGKSLCRLPSKNSISYVCGFKVGLTSLSRLIRSPLMPSQTSICCQPVFIVNFQCPECNIFFIASHQHDGHRRLVHRSTCKIHTTTGQITVDRSIDSKFPCPVDCCTSAFERSDNLQSHFKMHHME